MSEHVGVHVGINGPGGLLSGHAVCIPVHPPFWFVPELLFWALWSLSLTHHQSLTASPPILALETRSADEGKTGVQPVFGQKPRVGEGRKLRLAASESFLSWQARQGWWGALILVLPGQRPWQHPPYLSTRSTGPGCREWLPRKR